MQPSILTAAIVVLISAVAASCPRGEYESGGACLGCDGCTFLDNCPDACLCTSDGSCSSKALFCNRAQFENGTSVNVCVGCDSLYGPCNTPSSPTAGWTPVSGSSVTQNRVTYGQCSSSCGCSSHSQCPTGYFCGRVGSTEGANVCRRCDGGNGCFPSIAADGSCPVSNNCAASVECKAQFQCPSPKFCAGNYRCRHCAPDCYSPPGQRTRNSAFDANRALGGWCPESCCGFVTSRGSTIRLADGGRNTLEYTNGENIVFLLCDAQRYNSSGFAVVAGDGNEPDLISAQQVGSVSCTVKVDVSPDANTFPRFVPLVRCSVKIPRCGQKRFGIALFGTVAATGALVPIRRFGVVVSSRPDVSDLCGLGDSINFILTVVGAGLLMGWFVKAIVWPRLCGRDRATTKPEST